MSANRWRRRPAADGRAALASRGAGGARCKLTRDHASHARSPGDLPTVPCRHGDLGKDLEFGGQTRRPDAGHGRERGLGRLGSKARPDSARRPQCPYCPARISRTLSLPHAGLLTLGSRPGPLPDRAASLLPGLLAAIRTGLPPAGDDELTNREKTMAYVTVPRPALLGARKTLTGLPRARAIPTTMSR